MRSGGSYEHFAKGKRGKREVETRLGIQSINLLKILIVKCPEPNTTKNPPLQHIGRIFLFVYEFSASFDVTKFASFQPRRLGPLVG